MYPDTSANPTLDQRTADASPSDWVVRWAHLVPQGASVLDVACGTGRHVDWFASRGCRVTGVDRRGEIVAPLCTRAEIVVADIESEPWPLAGRRFDLVVVTNYLWRALAPVLMSSVADGGCLIWETFADGNQTIGKPSNPSFLLGRGELLELTRPLRVIAFEDGVLSSPTRFVQRIVAVRERNESSAPFRYSLQGAQQ